MKNEQSSNLDSGCSRLAVTLGGPRLWVPLPAGIVPVPMASRDGVCFSGSWATPRGLPTVFMPYSTTAALFAGRNWFQARLITSAPAGSSPAPATNPHCPGVGASAHKSGCHTGIPQDGFRHGNAGVTGESGRNHAPACLFSSRWQPPPTAVIPDRLAFGGIVTRL